MWNCLYGNFAWEMMTKWIKLHVNCEARCGGRMRHKCCTMDTLLNMPWNVIMNKCMYMWNVYDKDEDMKYDNEIMIMDMFNKKETCCCIKNICGL
jgi:hypothetical protein